MRNFNFENEEINNLLLECSNNDEFANKIHDEVYCLSEAIEILKKYDIDTTKISDLTEELRNKGKDIYLKQQNLRNKIIDIREKCNHKLKDNGWDSHYNYYICTICGEEMRY